MTGDLFDMSRFVAAQEGTYATALAELRHGKKQSHWIWFIFPQLIGLGSSSMSRMYGLSGLTEARAYMAHSILSGRLIECVEAALSHQGLTAEAMLGEIDAGGEV